MKITVIPIVFIFLASALIIPVGMSYASYGDSPAFAPSAGTNNPTPAPATNQTMTNQTMTAPTNQTMTNQTMTAPTNQTMTNQTMTTPTTAPVMTTPTTPAPVTPAATSTNAPTPSPSPLKQVQNGVTPKSVQCQSGFSLVLKAEDGSPACVHSSSVQILIQRGWAAVQ